MLIKLQSFFYSQISLSKIYENTRLSILQVQFVKLFPPSSSLNNIERLQNAHPETRNLLFSFLSVKASYSRNANTLAMKINRILLLFVIFLIQVITSIPQAQPEAEPENDNDRRLFRKCLMKNCRRCSISRWKLLLSRTCDKCAGDFCGSRNFSRQDWYKYNKFIERTFYKG